MIIKHNTLCDMIMTKKKHVHTCIHSSLCEFGKSVIKKTVIWNIQYIEININCSNIRCPKLVKI